MHLINSSVTQLISLFVGIFPRVGIDLPTIEVRFEHVNVEAEAYVGSRGLPTFINFSVNIVEVNFLYLFGVKNDDLTQTYKIIG